MLLHRLGWFEKYHILKNPIKSNSKPLLLQLAGNSISILNGGSPLSLEERQKPTTEKSNLYSLPSRGTLFPSPPRIMSTISSKTGVFGKKKNVGLPIASPWALPMPQGKEREKLRLPSGKKSGVE